MLIQGHHVKTPAFTLAPKQVAEQYGLVITRCYLSSRLDLLFANI